MMTTATAMRARWAARNKSEGKSTRVMRLLVILRDRPQSPRQLILKKESRPVAEAARSNEETLQALSGGGRTGEVLGDRPV